MLIDVKKAHLNGEVLEDEKVYVFRRRRREAWLV